MIEFRPYRTDEIVSPAGKSNTQTDGRPAPGYMEGLAKFVSKSFEGQKSDTMSPLPPPPPPPPSSSDPILRVDSPIDVLETSSSSSSTAPQDLSQHKSSSSSGSGGDGGVGHHHHHHHPAPHHHLSPPNSPTSMDSNANNNSKNLGKRPASPIEHDAMSNSSAGQCMFLITML